jgi:uncharacterized protein YutD
MKFDIWGFFDISRKSKFDLNLTRITDSLHEDLCTFMVTRWILITMRTVSDKTCRESQNTLSSINVFQKLCCLWDNVEKHDRPRQATNDNIYDAEKMQFACWIINARIQTHSYFIFIAFHGNNGYTNTPQYQIRTVPVLLKYTCELNVCDWKWEQMQTCHLTGSRTFFITLAGVYSHSQ